MAASYITRSTRSITRWPLWLGKTGDPERTAVENLSEPCRGGRYDELIKTKNPPWAEIADICLPISGIIEKWWNIPREAKKNRDHLRSMVAQSLDSRGSEQDPTKRPVCFELKVQKYIDDTHTLIEDTTAIWLELEAQRNRWLHKRGTGGRKESHQIPEDCSFPSRRNVDHHSVALRSDRGGPSRRRSPSNSQQTILRGFEALTRGTMSPRSTGRLELVEDKAGSYAGSRDTHFKENQILNVFIQ